MQSQILNGETYTNFIKSKSNILSIHYLNNNYGKIVVPIDLVLSILKDIELRLEYTKEEDDNESMEDIYQDI